MRRQNWLLVVRDSHASQFVARRIGPHMHRDAMSYILRQDVSKSMGEWLETGPSGGRFILGQHGRVARPSRRAGGFRRNERPRHSRSWQDDLSPILWRRAPPICNRLSSRTEPGVPRSVDECTGRDLLSLRDPAGAIARSRATRTPPGPVARRHTEYLRDPCRRARPVNEMQERRQASRLPRSDCIDAADCEIADAVFRAW